MNRNAGVAIGVLVLAGVAVLLPQTLQQPRPLTDLVPAGALLYVEAKDFASLVKDWNGSAEKSAWLASDNYQAFARSRLFLRLHDAQQEFGEAAGFAPDMSLVDAAAGANSSLALYDIGSLQFLYITRLPQARAYETMLWQSRAKFQPRKSAGIDYYVRLEHSRVAAFAVTNDLLLVATGEQALASALALIAGESRPAMKQEPWFQHATAAQATPGDIRMALNFERVAKTPYFRSYWIQRNTRELAQFTAVLSDLDRSPAEYRERRVLLRSEPAADTRASEGAVGEIGRFAPAGAGLFRAWAKPDIAGVLALISQKIILPRVDNPEERYRRAPMEGNVDAMLGSEEDLETRIDEPPVVDDPSNIDLQPLRAILESNAIEAMLHVEGSKVSSDGVFVVTPRAVALLGARRWDVAAARAAVESIASSLWTVSGPLSGLGRVWVTGADRVLILSTSEDLATAMSARSGTIPGAHYVMRFLHARELPRFQRMMTLIDYPSLPGSGETHEPLFFSEDIASLGRTLGRVDSVFLVSHDDGNTVTQQVVYKLQ